MLSRRSLLGRLSPLVLTVALVACGGGGSDGGPPAHLSADKRAVAVSASQDDFAPTGSVILIVDHPPEDGLVVHLTHSDSGLVDVDLIPLDERAAELVLSYRTPSSLNPDVYSDAVTVQVCTDDACNRQISGSPLVVDSVYAVTASQAMAPPTPEPTPAPPPPPPPTPDGLEEYPATVLELDANDVAWDATSGLLYVVTGGFAPDSERANAIVAVDPADGQVVAHAFAGSEPNRIVVSDDGAYAYVGFRETSRLARFTLPALVEDLSVELEPTPFFGATFVGDVAVSPADSTVFAIARHSRGYTEGLIIYDNGVPRPQTGGVNQDITATSLVWGATQDTLYAKNGHNSAFDLFVLDVDPSGVALRTRFEDAVPGYTQVRIHRAGDLIYTDLGIAVNPANGAQVGRYPLDSHNPRMAFDADLDRAFAVWNRWDDPGNAMRLRSFDRTRFVADQTVYVTVSDETRRYHSVPSPSRLIRWGDEGLAFVLSAHESVDDEDADDGQLILVSGEFVRGAPAPVKQRQVYLLGR